MPVPGAPADMAPEETTEDIAEVRSTAPQSSFTGRQVVIGGIVLLVGLLVVAGVPLAGSL